MPKSGCPCSVLESIADEIGRLDKTIERHSPPLGYGPGGGGGHGSPEARTGLRDSDPWKSNAGHYSMTMGDPKNVHWNSID